LDTAPHDDVQQWRRHKETANQGGTIREVTVSNLQEFHHSLDETPDKKSRTMVAVVVAIAIAGLGIYVYESGMWNPQPHQDTVSDSQLPAH
jgi:hypothetical protein